MLKFRILKFHFHIPSREEKKKKKTINQLVKLVQRVVFFSVPGRTASEMRPAGLISTVFGTVVLSVPFPPVPKLQDKVCFFFAGPGIGKNCLISSFGSDEALALAGLELTIPLLRLSISYSHSCYLYPVGEIKYCGLELRRSWPPGSRRK